MANEDAPFGATTGTCDGTTTIPCNTRNGGHPYPVRGAYGGYLSVGDYVSLDAKNYLVRGPTTINSNSVLLGRVSGIYKATMLGTDDPDYITLTGAGTTVEAYANVEDAADQTFESQEDSVGGNLAETDCGLNIDVAAGSAAASISVMELDSSSAATTITLPLTLCALSNYHGNAVGTNARWYVKMNHPQSRVPTGL